MGWQRLGGFQNVLVSPVKEPYKKSFLWPESPVNLGSILIVATPNRVESTHLQYTAMHCNALYHTATHCNALQRTATYCNALQRNATHYNTLQQSIASHWKHTIF